MTNVSFANDVKTFFPSCW